MEIIQVSANAPVSAVARAISSVVHEYHCVEVEAIGAEAVQRATQALALATGSLQHEGICVACLPKSKEVIVDNKCITLIRLIVKVTSTPSPSPVSSLNTSIKVKDLPRA
jgi:stage V sporulation protein SpoVS